MDVLAGLSAPFPPERVSWRIGSTTQDKKKGMALAFIDARDVMERLDAVCGAAGWQRRYPHAGDKTVCEIGIKIEDEWIWKADGAGDTDVEAEKGALSAAFKRAAVNWGIGRYLYDLASPWVALDQYKKIEQSEFARLEDLLRKGGSTASPPPGTPAAPAAPHEPGPAVAACNLAISMCATSAELKAWWEEHKAQVNALPDPDYVLVSAVMREKTAELKPKAVANG